MRLPGLLIPDGHLPSPQWRPVGWIGAAALASALAGTVFGERRIDDRTSNPLYLPGAQYLLLVLGAGILVLLLAGIAAVVTRYRGGTAVERQQLKWILAAFVAMIALGVLTERFAESLWFTTWSLLPIAFLVSIFRYRLYEST